MTNVILSFQRFVWRFFYFGLLGFSFEPPSTILYARNIERIRLIFYMFTRRFWSRKGKWKHLAVAQYDR